MADAEASSSDRRVLFVYLGRRGVIGQLALELAHALVKPEQNAVFFALSNQNELIGDFDWLGPALVRLDTFEHVLSASHAINFWRSRQRLLRFIRLNRISHVVTLMPHIWTPLFLKPIMSQGVHYTTIIHDAVSHPGDPTAAVTPWLRREAAFADDVVALSYAVANALVRKGHAPASRTRWLFLPDLGYGATPAPRQLDPDKPFSLLFLGRILAYKGLPILVDAVERLRADGLDIRLGVAGAGELADLRPRLDALGAETVNRWLGDAELAPLLARYDAVALPYTEASQSGVAAVAFANCVPIVATPIGGLEDQVVDGRTGVLSTAVSGEAFAAAIKRMVTTPGLYNAVSKSLFDHAQQRSVRAFAEALLRFPAALPARKP